MRADSFLGASVYIQVDTEVTQIVQVPNRPIPCTPLNHKVVLGWGSNFGKVIRPLCGGASDSLARIPVRIWVPGSFQINRGAFPVKVRGETAYREGRG